jgi:tetracenomycin A2 monooxygenase-dioxygenase
MDNHLNSEGQAFGKTYERGAFIDDGSPRPPHDHRHYWPSDRPGSRFPHMWLDAALTESTIDWFDTAFVLVCGPEGSEWEEAARAVAPSGKDEAGVPLVARRLPALAGPFSFGAEGAVLVRPDGYVAWRPDGPMRDKATAIKQALERILDGGTEAGNDGNGGALAARETALASAD